MSNSYIPSRKIDLPSGQPERWMEEVLESGEGSFKISDKGGNYIELHNGIFSMKHAGLTRQIRKSKETTRKIFITRLLRYRSFHYDGHYYYIHDGNWYKMKEQSIG